MRQGGMIDLELGDFYGSRKTLCADCQGNSGQTSKYCTLFRGDRNDIYDVSLATIGLSRE